MEPTIAQIYDHARGLLSDDDNELYTNTVLEPFLRGVHADLFQAFNVYGLQVPRKNVLFDVPANSTAKQLASLNAVGIQQVMSVQAGIKDKSGTITALSAVANGAQVTSAAHGLADGASVLVFNDASAVPEIAGYWNVSVVDDDNFVLLGVVFTGTYSSGGSWRTVTSWSEPFVLSHGPYDPKNVANGGRAPQGFLNSSSSAYFVSDGYLRFRKSDQDRVFYIEYLMSGTLDGAIDTTATLVDDSYQFYATALAGKAGLPKGNGDAESYLQLSYGPSLSPAEAGGYLFSLIQTMMKQSQLSPARFGRYGGPEDLRRNLTAIG